MFVVRDFVMSTILDEMTDWLYAQVVGFLSSIFALMGNMGVELFDLPWVQAVVLFFSQLGWALFGVSVVVSCFEFGIEYSSGRGNIRQTAMNCLKGFMAVSLFSTVPVRLYALSVTLQAQFTTSITGLGSGIKEVGVSVIEKLNSPGGLLAAGVDFIFGLIFNPILMLFSVILMAYAILKVFFANLKRGGILLIQIAVGSLYMFSVPRGYSDGFIQWCKQIVGLCLTAFLQATILVAGLMVYNDHALLGLGLMLSAGEVPRIAGIFGLDTSTKASLTSAAHTAQMAVNTTKVIASVVSK